MLLRHKRARRPADDDPQPSIAYRRQKSAP
jgi:hypothetical protein